MNGSIDDLAYVLATGLETPVINETGINGTFDARFNIAGGDIDSAKASFVHGLEKTRPQRTVHLYRSLDDFPCEIIDFHSAPTKMQVPRHLNDGDTCNRPRRSPLKTPCTGLWAPGANRPSE